MMMFLLPLHTPLIVDSWSKAEPFDHEWTILEELGKEISREQNTL